MASHISSQRVDLPTPDLALLPRDPWPNQLQFLLLVFQAKQSLELTEKAFEANAHYVNLKKSD
jgi:hypothetical protein